QIGIALMVAGIAMVSWFGYQYWSSTQSVTKLDSDVVKDSAETEDSSTSDDFTLEDGGKAEDESHSNVDYEDGDDIAQLVCPPLICLLRFFGVPERMPFPKELACTIVNSLNHPVLEGIQYYPDIEIVYSHQ